MIVRSFNPVERGQPAIWIEGVIASGQAASANRVQWLLGSFQNRDLVDVVIDSPGGKCAESVRVYNALREDRRQVRATILRAHSGASVVAMAADHIRIVPSATVFLHPPGGPGDGLIEGMNLAHVVAADLRRMADHLEQTDELLLDIYARRTGQPRDAIRKLSAANTTLNAAEALRLGFADRVVEMTPS